MSPRGNRAVRSAQVALSTTAAVAVALASTRNRATFKNLDGSATIYLGGSNVSTSNGMPLLPGESFTAQSTAAVYAVASAGTPTVAVFEEYD
jgi:hypothetical protein